MVHFNMTHRKTKYDLLTLVAGSLFLTSYFIKYFLWEKIWLFSVIPLVLFGITFVGLFILTITTKNRNGILIGLVIFGAIFVSELVTSEIFKSRKLLEATLMDDLTAIHLTLRADNSFEVVSSNMFSEDIYKGTYLLENNKIIFKDKRYSNNFIPDTLTIIGDKIIVHFDKKGSPITDFPTYFDIKENEIKNVP